jgi:16S rRNA (cytidine1402-2'-O)-methyltransferase
MAGRTVVFFEAPHRLLRTLHDILVLAGDREVVVGRELTKAHEELVRGPISTVVERFPKPRGEFVIVIDMAKTPQETAVNLASDQELLEEFCHMTKLEGMKRREAVASVAARHHRSPNAVYQAIERAKKSAE